MTKLNLIDGGGEIDSDPVDICGVCGVPDYARCGILDRHLQYMRLLGRSDLTVYARERLIGRLGTYLSRVRKNAAQRCPAGGEITHADYALGTRNCVVEPAASGLYAWPARRTGADATTAPTI